MMKVQSNLYEIWMAGPQELIQYHADIKRGKNVFAFEIYQTSNTISVFYIDQFGRQQMIASSREMLMMLMSEDDKKRYQNIIGDAEWVVLDGLHNQRGMTKEEEAAFLYLKEHVLDEMVKELDR
ncbi:hypothetical protein [Bacillus cereus]|uniref:hypothetical protein n=1 Tax=Bacillus cereus TaxID=1396 RepID=UPI000BFBCEB7|nr:hypothetical protein [Bacillus cereus]PGZ14682.1 hypothetical protein COE46_17810 [Bacillus cereus]